MKSINSLEPDSSRYFGYMFFCLPMTIANLQKKIFGRGGGGVGERSYQLNNWGQNCFHSFIFFFKITFLLQIGWSKMSIFTVLEASDIAK